MNGEQKQPIQPPTNSKWRAFFSKKWTFPVLYMGAAALILAFIMWYQETRDYTLDPASLGPDVSMEEKTTEEPTQTATTKPEAVPVQSEAKGMVWPVAEGTDVDVVMNFYDEKATDDVKAAALIQYEDSFWPHTGIDIAKKDGSNFDATAALPGKVTKAEKDPMVGYIVEIEHENGIQTIYQSLEDIQVAVGDEVQQGEVLGKAGRNLFEKKLGVHLHFEVKENGQSVSPDKFLSQAKDDSGAEAH